MALGVASALAVACLSAACVAHVDPQLGFDQVGALVRERAAHPVRWARTAEERAALEAEAARRLAEPLDAAGAVEVALLASPRIQALYEEIGISAADVVQAATATNPVLSVEALGRGGGTALEIGLAQQVLSLAMRPAARRLAETQYRRTQLAVAGAVLDHAAEVEVAYWDAVAAEHAMELRRTIASAAQAAAELAARMREAGTASELAAERERAVAEAARLAVRRAERERAASRERLARALGLDSDAAASLRTAVRLPDLPDEDPDLGELELLAVEERLDLAAAGAEVEALAQALGLTRRWRWLVLAELGVEADRELGGEWLVGPTARFALPILDRRRGAIERREAELRQAEHRLRATALEIRSQVRETREDLLLARDLVRRYRDVVIPLREKVVALLEQQHAFMLAGTFELLEARREEFESYEEYLHALRDYHVARARLARAVGGRLVPPAAQIGDES